LAKEERDILEEYLRYELRIIHSYLPYTRKTLGELLLERYPRILLRDGTYHYIKRRELEFLASLIPKEYWSKLKIPILLEVAPEYGEGAIVIRDPIEAMVVAKVLGIEYSGNNKLIIYRPQVAELRSKLPTTTQYVFSVRLLSER